MTRNQPACLDNSEYLAFVRQNYLTRLKDNLPKSVLDQNTWLTPPPIMQEVSLHTFKGLHFFYDLADTFIQSDTQKVHTESKAENQMCTVPISLCFTLLDIFLFEYTHGTIQLCIEPFLLFAPADVSAAEGPVHSSHGTEVCAGSHTTEEDAGRKHGHCHYLLRPPSSARQQASDTGPGA